MPATSHAILRVALPPMKIATKECKSQPVHYGSSILQYKENELVLHMFLKHQSWLWIRSHHSPVLLSSSCWPFSTPRALNKSISTLMARSFSSSSQHVAAVKLFVESLQAVKQPLVNATKNTGSKTEGEAIMLPNSSHTSLLCLHPICALGQV